MELIKEYTAFTRKVSEFEFNMCKYLGDLGEEKMVLTLSIPGLTSIEEITTSCPAKAMSKMMSYHLRRQAQANRNPEVKFQETPKLFIVE